MVNGFCSFDCVPQSGNGIGCLGSILALYVAPECWTRGYAQPLFNAALEALHTVGCVEVNLWVIENNHRAQKFYKKMGLIPTVQVKRVTLFDCFVRREVCLSKQNFLLEE